MCHQGPVFDFYVAGSSFLAVVVAEELVDGVDVDLGKEVATFFGEEVGTVLDVVHEEVLGEDGRAGGVVGDEQLLRLAPGAGTFPTAGGVVVDDVAEVASRRADGELLGKFLECIAAEESRQLAAVVAGWLHEAFPSGGRDAEEFFFLFREGTASGPQSLSPRPLLKEGEPASGGVCGGVCGGVGSGIEFPSW